MKANDDVLSSIERAGSTDTAVPSTLPVLPLRDITIYPHMIFPVLIGRASSLKAVAEALDRDKYIFVVTQKDAQVEDPSIDDLYRHGTIARILQVLRLPNNLLKVLVEGVMQGVVERGVQAQPCIEANVTPVAASYDASDKQLTAMVRHASDLFENYVKENRNLPPEVLGAFENIEDPIRKMYYAAANVQEKTEVKQRILDSTDVKQQYFELVSMLGSELEMLKLESEIDTKVHDQIQRSQRKFFIQEQIRALQKELGEDEETSSEIGQLREAIEKADLPQNVKGKVYEELDRLRKTNTMSPEYGVQRSWLEWIAALPWSTRTSDDLDVSHVRSILDEDHYDLERPKDRILEYISVLNLVGTMRGQILCFVGPPGVGKTSLATSIARATGRTFVRISLGGVRDEAEIRGHRRTYIGAMPGKIIQAMKRAGSVNPVILLDEVDKMSMDFRGDPSAALLEVLDPAQNSTFNDHYLEVDYDLSNVLFIATANVLYDIPAPLLDRMEVIELSSYLEPDKVEIAKRHILPRLMKGHGLDGFKLKFTDAALLRIVREYTREAGVRNLEREIATVLRKVAAKLVSTVTAESGPVDPATLRTTPSFKAAKRRSITVDTDDIDVYLRAPRFKSKPEDLVDKVGVATGLAWTSMGGDTLPVEVTMMPGTERLTLTGKLGDVMKESAMAALSYVRSNHAALGVAPEFTKGNEIHVHVPEGAIPKDGPSAGITMTLALISAATGRPLRGDLAMTGEVTLRGNVLPIGGLNEKLLAAKRAGITCVLVPKANESDVKELSPVVTSALDIVFVDHIEQAIPIAFDTATRRKTRSAPSTRGSATAKRKRTHTRRS